MHLDCVEVCTVIVWKYALRLCGSMHCDCMEVCTVIEFAFHAIVLSAVVDEGKKMFAWHMEVEAHLEFIEKIERKWSAGEDTLHS